MLIYKVNTEQLNSFNEADAEEFSKLEKTFGSIQHFLSI